MGPITVVFDTNVLVSALGFGGTPLTALLQAFGPGYQIAASEPTLAELVRVMEYDRLPFTPADREAYLDLLRREVVVVTPDRSITEIERDPDDDIFLECAVAADAAVIVSGDDHLRELGTFEGIDIVSPAEFLEESA